MRRHRTIFLLTDDLSGLEQLNFVTLFLEIRDLLTVRLSWFLNQVISEFKNSPCELQLDCLSVT